MEHTHALLTLISTLALVVCVIMGRRNETHRHEFYVDYAEITRRASPAIYKGMIVFGLWVAFLYVLSLFI